VNAAKGNFDGPRQDFQIDANDQLVTSADYKIVVVAYRNGAPVMLTDVGMSSTESRTTTRPRG
jgi:multidrug efflux pump